jgi:hypothetical protein
LLGQHPPHDLRRSGTGSSLFLARADRDASGYAGGRTQALCAIPFLYRTVLGREVGELEDLVRAKRRLKLPVVLTVEEVKRILANVEGVERLFLSLLYGTGLRLTEARAFMMRASRAPKREDDDDLHPRAQSRRAGSPEPDRRAVVVFARAA